MRVVLVSLEFESEIANFWIFTKRCWLEILLLFYILT